MALRHAALVSVRAGDASLSPLQLGEVFLSPLGLAAAAVAVPIVLLYLVRPDPEDLRLPTFRFLVEEAGQQRTNPFFSRFRRSLLLLLQVLVVLAIAVSLASPYVTVAERQTVSETVLVVDASASMATRTDGGTTRFARAVSTGRDEVTSRTTVVVATGGGRVLLRGGSPTEAEQALGDLRPTDAPGDLRGAIATASAVAGEEARIVVLSDFADDSDWATAVRTARARGLPVRLEQFGGGGEGNVGIVDRTFSGNEVEFAVRNFGDARVTRTLQFAGARRQLTLQPGDVATATFAVPAGGGTAQLSPGDAFPVDDAVAVAAPADATIDVLLLTNDRNRYLATAMEVIEPVSLTVDSPPTTVDEQYDVIVYSNLDPDSLLRGNVDAGRETLERGGGVVVAAQRSPPDRLSDLLLVAPQSVKSSPSIESTADDPLTRGIAFSPPEEYLAGPLREGRPLVRLSDGSPLIATAQRGPGRLLYYGYLESASSFRFNYQYPVFWKRAVFYLSGREPLPALNYRTGDQWTLGAEATVSTPRGQVTAATVPLDGAGFYAAGDRRVAAALLDEAESDVAAPPLEERSGSEAVPVTEETRQVPRDVSHWVALAAIVAVLGEVGFLRYRGDL